MKDLLAHIKHSDLDGDDVAWLIGRLGVIFLAESHDVHTLGTKRRTDGRCRRRLAGLQSQLYQAHHCRTIKAQGFEKCQVDVSGLGTTATRTTDLSWACLPAWAAPWSGQLASAGTARPWELEPVAGGRKWGRRGRGRRVFWCGPG
jgi:hypothetical protein